MDLALIDSFFRYGLFAVNLAVILFFVWQVNLDGLRGVKPPKWGLTPTGVIFLVVFNVLFAASKTGVQYWAWKTGGPLGEALLPPITPISYFLGYAGFRFWLPFLVNAVFAGLFFFVIYTAQKKRGRFFYKGEEYLAAISLLAVGWPGIIVYVPLVLLFMVGTSLFNTLSKRAAYTSFLYFWLPLALFSLLFGNQVIRLLGLRVLFITGS